MARGTYQVKPDLPFTPGVELCGIVEQAGPGVGSAAVQLGKALGAQVVGVVRGEAKAEVARSLGADIVVDRTNADFVEVMKDVTAGHGADVVFDPVGGDTVGRISYAANAATG